MRILFIALMGLLLFVMCCSTNKGPIHGRLINRLMSKFVSHVEKKYQVGCFGSGGAFMDKISEVKFAFDIPGPKSQTEMRTLMVNIAEAESSGCV